MSREAQIRALLGDSGGNVLDLRPTSAFELGHFPGAVPHPFPGDITPETLEEDLPSIFLPPREESLLVVAGTDGAATAAATHLESRGRVRVTSLALAADDWAELPPSLREMGPSRSHLWAPPRWLTDHVGLLPPPAAGPVLDLACGSGRAAVWLAERGYGVTGVDWQDEALELGRRLAASRGTACRFLASDLREPGAVPSGPWSVVLNFRFLERDLLKGLSTMTRPGGVVMLRTFREAPGYQGHPRPRFRLRPWELTTAFPRGLWEVLAHEQGFDPDGRPAAGIVARRRGHPDST